MSWGIPIWIYLWAAGMAGGVYFAAFLVNVFGGWKQRNLFRLAVYMGVPLAIIGVLMLVIDLGTPIWAWHLFVNFIPVSVMSMGTWILFAWLIVCFAMMILWMVERNAAKKTAPNLSKFLGWIGFFLAILLMGYTGVLLAASTQPIWANTLLLPALFVASAISTGVALLVLVGFAVNAMTSKISISPKIIERLAEADAVVIVIESLVLIGYAVWLGASGNGGSEALSLLISGDLALLFWIGFVLLALLLPFALDLFNRGKKIEQKSVALALGLSAVSVLVGGLILRALMTIGGQV